MKTVIKKIDTQWFDDISAGIKTWELRLADFDIEVGDILRLEEWIGEGENRKPTGRVIEKEMTYVRKVDLKKWIETQPELLEKGMYMLTFK
ncbi:MAG: hypothetical protein RJB39_387 [Candidatus Parcubacteria bacterium]|jgi:hypothetical protein